MKKLLILLLSVLVVVGCGRDKPDVEDKPKAKAVYKPKVKLRFEFVGKRIGRHQPSPAFLGGYNLSEGGLQSVPNMKLTLTAKSNVDATLTLGETTVKLKAKKPQEVTVDTLPYLQKVLVKRKTAKGLYHLAKTIVPWEVTVGKKKELVNQKLDIESHDLIRVWADPRGAFPVP